jgi:sugar phosphate permease
MKELEGVTRRILSTPTLAAVFVGSALISFGMNGLVGWAPTFLDRERGLSTAEASALLGTYGLLAGISGTVAGGYIADRLRGRFPTARLVTSSVGFLIGSPLAIWLLFIRDMSWFVPVFTASFFFLTWYNGPLTAVLFDVTPPQIATTIAGAYFMFIHIAGDAIAFPLVGTLSDQIGLQWAILLLPLAALLGALVVLLAVPHLTRDMARVAPA